MKPPVFAVVVALVILDVALPLVPASNTLRLQRSPRRFPASRRRPRRSCRPARRWNRIGDPVVA